MALCQVPSCYPGNIALLRRERRHRINGWFVIQRCTGRNTSQMRPFHHSSHRPAAAGFLAMTLVQANLTSMVVCAILVSAGTVVETKTQLLAIFCLCFQTALPDFLTFLLAFAAFSLAFAPPCRWLPGPNLVVGTHWI